MDTYMDYFSQSDEIYISEENTLMEGVMDLPCFMDSDSNLLT